MSGLLRMALALLAYAVVVTAAERGRPVRPRAADLLLDPAGAATALLLPSTLGAALVAGMLAVAALLHRAPRATTSEDRFHRRMAGFQVRIFLSLLYFPLLAPFALISRFSTDRFAVPAGGWRTVRRPAPELEGARRQS
jgi:hypothetical protein